MTVRALSLWGSHAEGETFMSTQEIKCPGCGKVFTIDESSYADIVKQVRDKEFDQQLHERLALAEQEKRAA